MSEAGEGARQGQGTTRAMRARALVVVGMHRSGTSPVARLLNLLGADLPQDLIPPLERDNAPGRLFRYTRPLRRVCYRLKKRPAGRRV